MRLLDGHRLDPLEHVTNVDARFVGRAVGHHVSGFHQSRAGLGLRMAIQPVHPFHAVFGRKIQLLLTEVEPSRGYRRQRQNDEEGANDLGLQFFHRDSSNGEYTSPDHFRTALLGPLFESYMTHQLTFSFNYLQLRPNSSFPFLEIGSTWIRNTHLGQSVTRLPLGQL